MNERVLRELPPLHEKDFMYVADRRKKEFILYTSTKCLN